MSPETAMEDTRPQGRRVRATVIASLPNAMFRLRREDGTELVAHAAGALRMQFTRLLPGDLVDIEESPFDRGKARIAGLHQHGSGRPTDAMNQPTNQKSELQP